MPISSKYLRISVTNICNLHCYFCHNEGQSKDMLQYELTKDDIVFIVDMAKKLGFTKIKLTGGEPTLRKDIIEIIREISNIGVSDFSIITNGVKLYELVDEFILSGLPRINVTLQTLNKKKFKREIHYDISKLDSIVKGIDKAISLGYNDVKINFIYHSTKSENDFLEICNFAAERNLIVVLLPILLINPRKEDKIISLDNLYIKLQSFGIISEHSFCDKEGIEKRLIKLCNGATILLRKNELADILPFNSCLGCLLKTKCREGIFPIRITSDGFLLPCLAEGISRIDLKDSIIKKDEELFSKIMNHFRIM